jgi:hypothetical protein
MLYALCLKAPACDALAYVLEDPLRRERGERQRVEGQRVERQRGREAERQRGREAER